jgi:hypothetical protein
MNQTSAELEVDRSNYVKIAGQRDPQPPSARTALDQAHSWWRATAGIKRTPQPRLAIDVADPRGARDQVADRNRSVQGGP